jgi:hypothetical protein
MTCVSSSIELEPEATKTPEVKPFNIINDEQQKQKHAASQFFSSLLRRAPQLADLSVNVTYGVHRIAERQSVALTCSDAPFVRRSWVSVSAASSFSFAA